MEHGGFLYLYFFNPPKSPFLQRGTYIPPFASRNLPPLSKEGRGGFKTCQLTDKPHNPGCQLNMPLALERLEQNLPQQALQLLLQALPQQLQELQQLQV